MSDLDQYAQKYLEHLRVANCSQVTIKGQGYVLNTFLAYLGEMGIQEVAQVTPEVLDDYQKSLQERVNRKGEPINVFSRNHRLGPVKSLFRFLFEEGFLLSNPARRLKYAREPKMLPRTILTAGEMKKLLAAPNAGTALGYRDRTILELMYSTGLRKGEVNRLKVCDMDTRDGFVRVNAGKWNKDRVVPLGRIASRWVENYIQSVRPEFLGVRGQNHGYLFVTNRGYPFSSSAVWGVVTRHARAAGLEKRVTPHLRHADDEEPGERAAYPGASGAQQSGNHPNLYPGDGGGFEGRAQKISSARAGTGQWPGHPNGWERGDNMKGNLSKQLKDPTKAARYLSRALEYGDPDNLQGAFLDLVKAQGGCQRVAARSGMNEWRVKLILWDEEESWKLLRLYKLLQGMGVRLVAVKERAGK